MKSFDKAYIEKQLEIIDSFLKEPITIYIIGGGAMGFYDLKTATKDIDIIVKTENEAISLLKALQNSKYKNLEKIEPAYLKMKTRAIIENVDGFRWDIFVNIICGGLTLSREMILRSHPFKKFKHMTIHLVSPEDLFIFKAVTSRQRDREDMFALFSHGLDIKIIKEEIHRQAQLDKSKAWFSYFFVGLDELVEQYKVIIPEYDWFLKIAEHEIMERLVVEFIKKKPRTINDLVSLLKCEKKEIQQILGKLQKNGNIIKKDEIYLEQSYYASY
jgi:hypothetical protein